MPMSAGISGQAPLAQQTVPKCIFFSPILALGQVLSLQKSRGEFLCVPGFCPGAEAEPEREQVGAEEPGGGCGKPGCMSSGKDL